MTWIEYCIKNNVSQYDSDMRYRKLYFSAFARFVFANRKKKLLWRNVLVNGQE